MKAEEKLLFLNRRESRTREGYVCGKEKKNHNTGGKKKKTTPPSLNNFAQAKMSV